MRKFTEMEAKSQPKLGFPDLDLDRGTDFKALAGVAPERPRSLPELGEEAGEVGVAGSGTPAAGSGRRRGEEAAAGRGAATGARRRWGAGDAGGGGPATREKKRGAAEGSGPVGRGGGLPAGSGGPTRLRRCGRLPGTHGAAVLAEAGGWVERTLSGAGRTRPSAAEEGDLFFLGFRGAGEIRKRRGVYIGIEGARRVQMRCGFRPRDRDRTL